MNNNYIVCLPEAQSIEIDNFFQVLLNTPDCTTNMYSKSEKIENTISGICGEYVWRYDLYKIEIKNAKGELLFQFSPQFFEELKKITAPTYASLGTMPNGEDFEYEAMSIRQACTILLGSDIFKTPHQTAKELQPKILEHSHELEAYYRVRCVQEKLRENVPTKDQTTLRATSKI